MHHISEVYYVTILISQQKKTLLSGIDSVVGVTSLYRKANGLYVAGRDVQVNCFNGSLLDGA